MLKDNCRNIPITIVDPLVSESDTSGLCRERSLVHGILLGQSRGGIAKPVPFIVMDREALLQPRVLRFGFLQDRDVEPLREVESCMKSFAQIEPDAKALRKAGSLV